MKLWLSILILCLCFSVIAQTQFSVTTYGAIGNTTNALFIVISNSTSFSANQQLTISNSVQINNAGAWGVGNINHQGFYAYIKTVDGTGTNGTFDRVALNTTNFAPGYMGLDCTPEFLACYSAATNAPLAQINITNGWYMLLLPTNYSGGVLDQSRIISAINEFGGNILWVGQNKISTVLIGPGAWQVKGTVGFRGSIFMQQGGPNVGSETYSNMTINGACIQGRTSFIGDAPMNPTNGGGWDNTQHAYVCGNNNGNVLVPTNINFLNMFFTNIEGEQVISTTTTSVPFLTEINCQFGGGDGSAENIQYPHLFQNVSDIGQQLFEEYDEQGQSHGSIESGILVSNVYSGWALAGSTIGGNNPLMVITNFSAFGTGGGILTAVWTNLLVINGIINFPASFEFSTAGGEGNSWNGGAVISGVNFQTSYYAINIGSESGPTANVMAQNCLWTNTGANNQFALNSGYTTNIFFYSNSIVNGAGNNGAPFFDSIGSSGQWMYDDPSDNFPNQITAGTANVTNQITYAYGYHQSPNPIVSGCSFSLDDSQPLKIPSGASMLVTNQGSSTSTLYSSATPSFAGAGVSMPTAYSQVWLWNNFTFRWQTNPVTGPIIYYLMRMN